MRVLGIIAEYNPFHNGHLHHLQESIRIAAPDYTVCVMSGDFMQRGEPALADKWIRAEMAVRNGINLVLELPFAYACNNAEYFAYGAVDLLNRIGCITQLSFGSEAGDLAALNQAAEYLSCETEELKNSIRDFSGQGLSFPKARYEAVKQCMGPSYSEVLQSANNILGVEYLKQLHRTGSQIEPLTIRRYGTGYHDKHSFENIASASAIRLKLAEGASFSAISQLIPSQTLEVLDKLSGIVNLKMNDFYKLMLYRILTSEAEDLNRVLSATEGLENRVKNAAVHAKDMDSLMKAVQSKRYTETRIRRLLAHTLLGLTKEDFAEILEKRINYARVLGFDQKGASLLKTIKKEELNQIPVLTNINRELQQDAEEWKLLKYDIKASDIYHLVTMDEIYSRSDYVCSPYKDFA